MTPDPLGPVVVIGLKEIYDQLLRLTTQVEILIGDQRDTEARTQDHEARLRALERGRWPLPALAVLISLASVVLTFVKSMS